MMDERKVYAVGHYALIFIALMFCCAGTFIVIHNELYPPPLLEACPVGKK